MDKASNLFAGTGPQCAVAPGVHYIFIQYILTCALELKKHPKNSPKNRPSQIELGPLHESNVTCKPKVKYVIRKFSKIVIAINIHPTFQSCDFAFLSLDYLQRMFSKRKDIFNIWSKLGNI